MRFVCQSWIQSIVASRIQVAQKRAKGADSKSKPGPKGSQFSRLHFFEEAQLKAPSSLSPKR